MNSTAIKEAVAVGYPREKMYGVWWSGAEPDVRPAEAGAKGYNAATLQHTAGQFKLHEDLKKYLYDKGLGTAKWEETGEILYVRGLINAMLGVEAIRTAQERFGKKPLTGEQVRWGLENLDLTAHALSSSASRACCVRSGYPAPITRARASDASRPGTARTGRSHPTGTPATTA
jgi:branched-chain amino acid transport system substrate-binding protein